MSPHLRTYQGSGCPFCSNNRVLAGFNDLASKNPEVAGEAFGWDPTTVQAQSGSRRKFQCGQGHIWTARISDRTAKGAGCPSCAKTGFDPNKSGWLYLIEHDQFAMHQIGISNNPHERLASHNGRGWEVIEIRGPMDGHLTQQLETSCLRTLKKRGAALGQNGSRSKFDGHTEAWTTESLNVSSIKQILDWVYQDEAK